MSVHNLWMQTYTVRTCSQYSQSIIEAFNTLCMECRRYPYITTNLSLRTLILCLNPLKVWSGQHYIL